KSQRVGGWTRQKLVNRNKEAVNQELVGTGLPSRRLDASGRPPPPSSTSDDYSTWTWTVDQQKLECTSRKLSVAKNTNKAARVAILQGYDESQTGMELLLENQRFS
ncbi:hypothetical protein L917_03067, partial [Phytophthora nicotianae]